MNANFVLIGLGALGCLVLAAGTIAGAFQYTRNAALNEEYLKHFMRRA